MADGRRAGRHRDGPGVGAVPRRRPRRQRRRGGHLARHRAADRRGGRRRGPRVGSDHRRASVGRPRPTVGGRRRLRCRDRGGLHGARLVGACDVRIGFVEAARLFAPQKGATADQVGAARSSASSGWPVATATSSASTWRRCPGPGRPEASAAPSWPWGASCVPATSSWPSRSAYGEAMAGADLVMTGEGALDAQSFLGKVVGGVIDDARRPVCRWSWWPAGPPSEAKDEATQARRPGRVTHRPVRALEGHVRTGVLHRGSDRRAARWHERQGLTGRRSSGHRGRPAPGRRDRRGTGTRCEVGMRRRPRGRWRLPRRASGVTSG